MEELVRLDSGANMFVAHKKKYLYRFKKRKIAVQLAIETRGEFEGVGIMLASSSQAPGFLFMCYPTFLASRDTCCTVTNGAFMKYSGFDRVIIDTWREAHFNHTSGIKFTLPLFPKNTIDYLKLKIHVVKKEAQSHNRLTFNALSLHPLVSTHPIMRGTVAQTLALHIAYGHRSVSALQLMIDKGFIKGRGVPKKLAPLPFRCQICDAAGATMLRRGRLVDTTKLPFGVLWHIDFTFFNVTLIRGLTSVLLIVEESK